MKYNLEGKGIFVFSDPAGANAVLSLIEEQVKRGFTNSKDFLVFSNRSGVFSKEYDRFVERFEFSEDSAIKIIKEYNPSFLFSATSLNDFEHKWRKVAKKLKLKTISFIDHWTCYVERFTYNGETILSDEVWVVNDKAQEEAVQAGIPSEKIKVVGNPYYTKVKHFVPSESKYQFYSQLGINVSKKTILFISDDIKRAFPSDENGNCTLGFDEYTVLSDIFDAFSQLTSKIDWSNFQFIIKLHPRDEVSKFENICKKGAHLNLDTIVIQKCDPLSINYYSDIVLGMFSNMIIESCLLNKRVLRVQIGEKLDPLSSAKDIVNELQKVTQKEFLVDALLNILNTWKPEVTSKPIC